MLKVVMGTALLVGILGFAACNGGTTPPPGGSLADCPAKITVLSGASGFSYSVPSCQLKVGSSVTIEASGSHPLIGFGSQPLVTPGSSQVISDFTFQGTAQDVDKTFAYKCNQHGFTASIKVVAAQ